MSENPPHNAKVKLTFLIHLVFYDVYKGKHCLSGIGHISERYPSDFAAPKTPYQAFIGRPARNDMRLTNIYPAQAVNWLVTLRHSPTDWRDLPIAVHMSCWRLARLIFGSTVEDNLDLFAAIALQTAWIAYGLQHTSPIRRFNGITGKY